jgi:hypothetical protein
MNAPAPVFTAASTTPLRIEGRHSVSARQGIALGFPGTQLSLRLHGRALALRLEASNNECYFDLRVNGGPWSRLRSAPGLADYPLLAQSEAGEALVELIRRNESWQGTCEILGFSTDEEATWLELPAPSGPRLLFIGDSITCGEKTDFRGDDPLLASSPTRACSANARLSYGMLLADSLGARCHLVSYGGRGILRDWQGIKACANAPRFYERARPDIAEETWDHGRYVPQVIGVCLGTNDFNQGIPEEDEFVNAYVELLRKILRDAPGARVLLIDSPIVRDDPVTGPRRSVLRHYLQETLRRLGDVRASHAPVSVHPGIPGDGHPSGTEHRSIAAELLPLFRDALAAAVVSTCQ